METRGETTSPITLWYNAPPQADSAQSVGRTFGESAYGGHATRRRMRGDRGAIRDGRGVGVVGTGGWHPRDIHRRRHYHLCPVPSLGPSSSRSRVVAHPLPVPLSALPPRPHRPTVFPAAVHPRWPPFVSLSLPFSLAHRRGSRHRLRYRLAQLSLVRARRSLQHPNAAHRHLLHLYSHLHLPPRPPPPPPPPPPLALLPLSSSPPACCFSLPSPPPSSAFASFSARADTNCKKVFPCAASWRPRVPSIRPAYFLP